MPTMLSKPVRGVKKRQFIAAKVAGLLKLHLEDINQMCRPPDDPLAKGPKGIIQWPSDKDLDSLSSVVRCLAALYGLGDGSTWSCILAIQNRRPSLKLKKRVEDLIDRASKLYHDLPRSIEIDIQAKQGSAKAKACFKDLQRCFNGQAEIAAIKWDEHGTILAPSAAKGESCNDRAAQICIDWLRWKRDVDDPALSLSFWLIGIGNLSLAKKVEYSGSTDFFEEALKDRARKSNSFRQKKHRLKDKKIKLVQEEIKIIDSPQIPEFARKAAEERLMRYTNQTADEWRRFLVKKA